MDNSGTKKPLVKNIIALIIFTGGVFCCFQYGDAIVGGVERLYPNWNKFLLVSVEPDQQGYHTLSRAVEHVATENAQLAQQYAQLQEQYAELASSSDALLAASSSDLVLQTIFVTEDPKVLLVPGHTSVSKGAVYGDTTEFELNYFLVQQIAEILRSRGYEVVVSHNSSGYSYRFESYFDTNRQSILDWRDKQKELFAQEYPQGVVTNDTDHNTASEDVAVQLYGINKWAGEHDVDAVLHVHFNDYPGRQAGERGVHNGFSIFTPLKKNNNFVESFTLAKSFEQMLLAHASRSTVRAESAGVLESELIAPGAWDTLSIPAVLLEAGFIYEEQFTSPELRQGTMGQYAQSIADGFDQYFAR